MDKIMVYSPSTIGQRFWMASIVILITHEICRVDGLVSLPLCNKHLRPPLSSTSGREGIRISIFISLGSPPFSSFYSTSEKSVFHFSPLTSQAFTPENPPFFSTEITSTRSREPGLHGPWFVSSDSQGPLLPDPILFHDPLLHFFLGVFSLWNLSNMYWWSVFPLFLSVL